MTNTIDIFNDIINILDSIVLMEKSIGKTVQAGEKFIDDFKSGNLEKTQGDCDLFTTSLGEIEKTFKEKTVQPAMDLYQEIKKLLHIHIGNAEKQLLMFEDQSSLKPAKQLLEKIKEK